MTYLLTVCATMIATGVLLTLFQRSATRHAQSIIRECVADLKIVQANTTSVQKCFVQSSPYYVALEDMAERLDNVLDLLED